MVERVERATEKQDEGIAEAAPYHTLYFTTAGLLLSVAGAIILIGIITAEALYPAPYDTAANTISDLGGTMPSEGGVVLQPSATIFDATMIVAGAMILISSLFVYRATERRGPTIPLALLGTGVLGVGIFPGHVPVWHPIFALLAFVAGGVAAVGEMAEERGLECEEIVAEGSPHESIILTSERVDADLVILGSTGMTGLKRALLGSVSRKVLIYSERPVLLVREP